MPHGIKGWAVSLCSVSIFTILGHWLFKLADNAMLTWIDDQIANFLGLQSPQTSTVVSWVVPAVFVSITFLIYHTIQSRISTYNAKIASARLSIEWKKPLEAIESFGDQLLINEKDKWTKTFLDAQESLYQTEKKIDELERNERNERNQPNLTNLAVGVPPPEESPELSRQRRIRKYAIIGDRISKDELPRIWADLREDIGKKLESGELASKGVPAPYLAGKSEAEIAPHEWRLLTINPQKEQAIEKNGGEIKYVGLIIGRKRK